MTRPKPIVAVGLVVAAAAIAWLVFTGVARLYSPRPADPAAAAPPPSTGAERKINATLFFVSEDGFALVGAQREIPFGEAIAEQARHIIEAQLAAAPAPLANAVPEGTALKALFISERGEAFVDLSGTVTAKHPGGALDELFTVYAVVNALTVNLPAVTRVQILIDGKEVDTLAGHVDLRHPLQKSMKWVRTDKDAS
jgi:Sporulation and spore germination